MIYLTPLGVRWRFVVLSAFLWACSLVKVVLADTLSLHNGNRLSGTLVSVAEEKVIFETTYAGSITVEQRAIQSL